MIKDEDIICISNTTWFGEYTKSTVQLLSLLATRNRVIFVEYPFTWKDIFTTLLGKQKAPVSRMLGLKKRLKTIDTEKNSKILHLAIPPVLPVRFIKWDTLFFKVFKINSFIYRRQLIKCMKKLNIENPIVITAYNPFYGLSMIGKLNEKLNIYYCYDGPDKRKQRARIVTVDKQLSEKADAVITTSEFLNSVKKKINAESYTVKNGVDFDLFSAFAKQEVYARKRKLIGYIGSMDNRFDIDNVEFVIQNLPDADFEFTGNVRKQSIKEKLEKYPNVHFRPAIKPNEVPQLLSSYDIGIIPYKINEINKNIYPLKINEYLATGVPVVMTSFANLPEFEKYVSFAPDKETFLRKVNTEIKNDSITRIKDRVKFAQSNSWENRAEAFSNIISKFLNHENSKVT
jgi:teichuronic acid biosynthesis glycosyltransferase TuaH